MLRSEFVGRTHYNPDCEEYHYIEESYYERALRAEDAIKMLCSAIGYAQFCVDEYQRIEQQYNDDDKEVEA